MASPPIVRVVPSQPHCFAFGGFEVQMIAAMEAARGVGADITPLDFWRREADFDLLHFWSVLGPTHSDAIKWAHAGGKKVMLSTLLHYPGWRSFVQHLASLASGPARLLRPMLAALDCITVVNEAQAKYLVGTVRFPAEKVAVVPNVVEDIFFGTGDTQSGAAVGIENYVLCVGNICLRKKQLSLIGACRKLGVPLLLVGRTLTGEEAYGQAVAEAVSATESVRWIPWLNPGSAELAAAYRGARVFALLSRIEQQPISALEAAATRTPLVLADRPWAKQEFYQHAVLADASSVDTIAMALRKALDNPDQHCPPTSVIQQCRKEEVGAAYMAVYQRLVHGAA
jgi:glycosyltransferase involved in cell wall biosynthesis